jgi:hypothetical protein
MHMVRCVWGTQIELATEYILAEWEGRVVGDQRHPRSSSKSAVTRQDRPIPTADPSVSRSPPGNATEDTFQIRAEMLQIRADALQMRNELAELRNLVNQLLLSKIFLPLLRGRDADSFRL